MEQHSGWRHARHGIGLDNHHLARVRVHEGVHAREALDAQRVRRRLYPPLRRLQRRRGHQLRRRRREVHARAALWNRQNDIRIAIRSQFTW